MAFFLTCRGLLLTLDSSQWEQEQECEIRTCGLLGVLEGSLRGERGILFKRIRNTLKMVTLERFKELDEMEVFTLASGHGHLAIQFHSIFINGDWTPMTFTLSSLCHVLLDLPFPPWCLYISGPLAKPLPMTVFQFSVLYHSPLSLSLWIKNSQSYGMGVLLVQVTFHKLHLQFWLLKNCVLAVRQCGSFSFSQ